MQTELPIPKVPKKTFRRGTQKDLILRILAKDKNKWWNAGNIIGEHELDGEWVWVTYEAQARFSELKQLDMVELGQATARNKQKTKYTIFKHKD